MSIATAKTTTIVSTIIKNLSSKTNDTHDFVNGLKKIWNNPNVYNPGDGGQQTTALHKAAAVSYRDVQSLSDGTTPSDWVISSDKRIYASDFNKLAIDTEHVSGDISILTGSSPYPPAGNTSDIYYFPFNQDLSDVSDRKTISLSNYMWYIASQDTVHVNVTRSTEDETTIPTDTGVKTGDLVDGSGNLKTTAIETVNPLGATHPPIITPVKTGSVIYTFPTGFYPTSYSLESVPSSPTSMAKSWSLYGSIDGTAWTLLDTRSNISTWLTVGEKKKFNITTDFYRMYKLSVTDNCGDTILHINSIEFATLSVTVNTNSESFTTISQPADSKGIIQVSGIILATPVPNNVKAEINVDVGHVAVAGSTGTSVASIPRAVARATIIKASDINNIENTINSIIATVGQYSSYWDASGICQRSCQLSCQVGCQVSCQVCVNRNCHNQNCGMS